MITPPQAVPFITGTRTAPSCLPFSPQRSNCLGSFLWHLLALAQHSWVFYPLVEATTPQTPHVCDQLQPPSWGLRLRYEMSYQPSASYSSPCLGSQVMQLTTPQPVLQISVSTFFPWFLTSKPQIESGVWIIPRISTQMPAFETPCQFHLDGIRMRTQFCFNFGFLLKPFSSNGPLWVSDEMQLTTALSRNCATLIPHSAFRLCCFSRFPQTCSGTGALSFWVSGLDFADLFLQPHAQLQLSTSIGVPNPRWHQVTFDILPLVPHIIVTQTSSSCSWV